MIDGDLETLRAYVDGLDTEGRSVARAWCEATHDFEQYPGPPEITSLPNDQRYLRWRRLTIGKLLMAARLFPPAAAAKALVRWDESLAWNAVAELRRAFVEHDRAWAVRFVAAADAQPLPADGGAALALVLRQIVVHHGLPAPSGRLFHAHGVRRDPRWDGDTALADAIRVDPLLPDVVHHLLASGESGNNPALPDAIETLVGEGWLSRERLLADVLEHLTSTQRVSSQRVLAGIASRLGLTAAEVTGGLPYLLGVMASSRGEVVKVLLPLAIELVSTPDELGDLARVVAARPEKGVRQTLLKALAPKKRTPEALGERLGNEVLVEALELLAVGEDDVVLREAVERARVALGGSARKVEPVAAGSQVLGLWDVRPDPAPFPADATGRTLPYNFPTLRELWLSHLRTGQTLVDGNLTDRVLPALATGELDPRELLSVSVELSRRGVLSPARASLAFEPLILGGAMSVVWSTALMTADLCAAEARPPTGLDRLVRMLGQYASETPAPQPLPPHLARLALKGRSKTAQEARILGARLAGVAPEDYDPAPDAAAEPAPQLLGLWRKGTEHRPDQLAFPVSRDLSTIGRRAAAPSPAQPVRGTGAAGDPHDAAARRDRDADRRPWVHRSATTTVAGAERGCARLGHRGPHH